MAIKRPIERQWWFTLPTWIISGLATNYLLSVAGLDSHAPSPLARVMLIVFTLLGMARFCSYLLWAALVWFRPDRVAALEPPR